MKENEREGVKCVRERVRSNEKVSKSDKEGENEENEGITECKSINRNKIFS